MVSGGNTRVNRLLATIFGNSQQVAKPAKSLEECNRLADLNGVPFFSYHKSLKPDGKNRNCMIPKIFHDLSTSNPAHKKIRWSIDRDLLIEEWKRNPNRTRTAFYLAQSYECLNDYQNSFKW